MLGPVNVCAGPVLHSVKAAPFPMAYTAISPGPSFIFADPPLFTIQTNKLPICNLTGSYAMGDPLRLSHLTMGNRVPGPGYTYQNENQTYCYRQNL
ncbi:MAG: hypothetical protein B1H12_06450 [Desulfobacteraceae bacterium 4484_190.2]|nr:MAG: hypothetical protein B1H12_06450 [Desulfobacteraceae bacterium 4484_190.2]